MEIIPLPAFSDNYLWLIREGRDAAVVDPGDAAPVASYLDQHGLRLRAILLTHHHADHIGGVSRLARDDLPVFGPADESIPAVTDPRREGDLVEIPAMQLAFRVIDVPGHTQGHIAYYGHGALFCGDALFSAGCGRIFEGTAPQLYGSLRKLAALPDDTRVYCAHEYTLANLRFAQAAEPDNEARDRYLEACERERAAGRPTLPTTIGSEKRINPFLRCGAPGVRAGVGSAPDAPEVEVFAALREWKNRF